VTEERENMEERKALSASQQEIHSEASDCYCCHDDDDDDDDDAGNGSDGGSDALQAEQMHFESVCEAYRQYAKFGMAQWSNHQYRLQSLPESQRKLLPVGCIGSASNGEVDEQCASLRAQDFKDALIRNQFCLDCILSHAGQPHSQQSQQQHLARPSFPTDEEISKVASVLKSLARDWSSEGKLERDGAYVPIIALVQKYLDPSMGTIKISVPGSGVGRLAFELTALGYSVQGNDFSLYMLIASDFILNNGGMVCNPERPLKISPWLLESRNLLSHTDPIRTVDIPDVDPMATLMAVQSQRVGSEADFSMAAGDFVSIYSLEKEDGQWDCVASCFFLDACPNIIQTLQVIYKMLKPGGFLINLGPLLYHWSGPLLRPDDHTWNGYRQRYAHLDDRYLTSIDLSYDDVKAIMANIGFEILEEVTGIECFYTADQRSMMNTIYRCVSFVAKKK
jgi:carnosine N-methyltransferase